MTSFDGSPQPVFVIAEAGVNHNGDVEIAHRLIDKSADAGADAVKFQTFLADEVVSKSAPAAAHHIANVSETVNHYDLIKKLELPLHVFGELKKHCEDIGITFISTPYDIISMNFLKKIGVNIIKIASSELTNLPLLDIVRNSSIPVILSTGMSNWSEIIESVQFLLESNNELCLLKCTSNYPATVESINLRGIQKFKETYPDLLFGFSDHTEGFEISLTAVGMGVHVIERHFTLDKKLWGPDHRASLEPFEFKKFADAIRKAEGSLGNKDWNLQEEEKKQKETMRKGVYARRDLNVGEIIGIEDVKFLRPMSSLDPRTFYKKYKDKRLLKSIKASQLINEEFFEIDQ